MNIQIQQLILDEISTAYLNSRDFNGMPIRQLQAQHEFEDIELRQHLAALIDQEKIALVFGDIHPNPHIRALPDEPQEDQLRKLESSLTVHTCAYPTGDHLVNVIVTSDYAGRPYQLALALGEPQLTFRAFDLYVLEFYRNDPRYSYTTNDVSGSVSVVYEYAQSGSLPEQDQIVLQHFGFCYDDDLNRAVAVTIRYLADLTPEHQQMWKLKELSGHYLLHPDFDRQIRGEWPERISIFDAFLEELELTNRMCGLKNRPPLFRDSFEESRPREFAFLIRPTLNEFNDFVLLLDKMMSDNINKKFFSGEVEEQVERVRPDGRIEVQSKGTIALLEEWLTKRLRTPDPKPKEELIDIFKEVRQKRQKPAHAVNANEFDQKYFHEQRELMIRAYTAMRTLRLIFANWPEARSADLEVNQALFEGNIWTY